jgi:hypothetical protein
MATPSAKEIYEQHIKPLPLAERLRLVEMIAHEIAGTAEEKTTSKRSILELEGLGADLWEGIDAQEYVNELRKEWDHRP